MVAVQTFDAGEKLALGRAQALIGAELWRIPRDPLELLRSPFDQPRLNSSISVHQPFAPGPEARRPARAALPCRRRFHGIA